MDNSFSLYSSGLLDFIFFFIYNISAVLSFILNLPQIFLLICESAFPSFYSSISDYVLALSLITLHSNTLQNSVIR